MTTQWFRSQIWWDLPKFSEHDITEMVCPGTGAFVDLEPAMLCISRLGDPAVPLRILDLGSGPGRNARGMLQHSPHWSCVLYDSPAMLARSHAWLGDNSRLEWIDDWGALRLQQFDAVLESLVFQHCSPDEVRAYARDLRQMTPRLVCAGRDQMDGGVGSVWGILAEHFHEIDRFTWDASDHLGKVLIPRPEVI